MLKGALAHGFLFLLIGIFVMKYLFICKWKRLRPLDDDFLVRITVLCAVLFGVRLQLAKMNLTRSVDTFLAILFAQIV